jgi:hypothetical protein
MARNWATKWDGQRRAIQRTWWRSVDSVGNVYVADTGNNKIQLGKPVLVTQPAFTGTRIQWPAKTFKSVTASTNQLVLIQATSVLPATNWITIQTVTLWNGRTTFTDASGSIFLPTSIALYRRCRRGFAPYPCCSPHLFSISGQCHPIAAFDTASPLASRNPKGKALVLILDGAPAP